MGFTVRFVLGAVLVLSCFWLSETAIRQIREVHDDGEGKNERATEQGPVANLTEETSKPKTDLSTEDNKTLDKQNSLSKLQKSETYKKATNQPEINREDIARSIDIDKYVSKEFHSKNNVYRVSVSPDNEKYVDHDYSYHPTTDHDDDHTKEFRFDGELTTPKSRLFDHKYREAVESVEQKLEHIDDSHELSLESESKENLNLEKLYDETQNNDTKANLNYINYRSIISNDTSGKNAVHKDLVVEAGTNLDFRSSYNETTIIDDDDNENNTIVRDPKSKENDKTISNVAPSKGDQDRSESSTTRTIILTTRKSLVLTKPPSNKNTSHISILSNNIETETVKAINPIQSGSLPTTEKPKGEKEVVEEYTLKNPINISKRGKVKYADYSSTEASVSSNEIKKKNEQLFQENQLVPVHIEAPSTEKLTETTTGLNIEEPTTSEIESTTNYVATTETTTVETESEAVFTTVPPAEPTAVLGLTTTSPVEEITTIANEDLTTTVATTTETEKSTSEDDATIVTTMVIPSVEPLMTENDSNTLNFENSTEITSESTLNFNTSSTTEIDEDTTTVLPETTINPIISKIEIDKNSTMTTENIMRTSKGIVFRETVPTTEPTLSTTEFIPTTQPIPTTTEGIVTTTFKEPKTQSNEQPVMTTTETNVFVLENRTSLVPDLRSGANETDETTTEQEIVTEGGTMAPDSFNTLPPDDNSGTIAAITISTIGAVCLILLAGLLIIMRKRQKRFNYGQRCTPVSLGHYSIDNVSTYNSVRRKGELRDSKRSYRNIAFEDPAAISHPLNFPALGKFVNNAEDMKAEFEEIPQITARTNELPEGCDVKNRYANVIPLPETRVPLSYIDGYPNSDYINANYVTGPKNIKGYYIACQAPMQNTVDDFWRMIWEQQTKVILMITHLYENGMEKCFDYLPPSEVLDCHRAFGDFLVTLKKREVKDKYIISTLQLKNMVSSSWREVTHFWYLGWPEKGVPSEANSLIAFLIEARSYMKSSSIDRKNVTNSNLTNGTAKNELNPVVVHCSPGTGRTGVVIACDIAIREFEQTRLVDIPRIVYKIRRDRASAVQTKDQYAFIYKVINLYATKLTGDALDSF